MAGTPVEEVAYAALSAVGSNAGTLQAIKWTSDRYRQLANRSRLRALRKVDQVVIPAAITEGTVTATRDSAIITGDATAQAAWAAVPNDGTNYFRFRRNWYKIAEVEVAGGTRTLKLHNPVAEESSATVGYKIVQRHTKLPSDLRYAGRFVQQRLWRPITQMSLSEVDLTQPERLFVAGTGPEMVCEIGDAEDGSRLFEFYPYPLRSELILFSYYARSPELKPGDNLPDNLDVEALKQGVLIDVYRYEMAQALRKNQVEVAAVWGNHLRTQEAVWEDRIHEMQRADRSVDDLSIIIHTNGPPTQGDMTFIRTARQDAISRLGNFP